MSEVEVTTQQRRRLARAPRAHWWLATCTVLVAGALAAEGLLAYRWASPVGSISLGRVLLLITVVAMAPRLLRLRVGPDGVRFVAASGLVLASITVGLMHSEYVRTGFTQLVNAAEATLLFATLYVMSAWLAATSLKGPAALVYIAFVPSGLIGVLQATRLAMGETPFIPFLWLFSLDDQTANAGRTAFGSGLNEFGLDRVAAATGDPPTFGIQCAVLLVMHVWIRRHGGVFAPGILVLPVVALAGVGLVLSASTTAILVTVLGTVVALLMPTSTPRHSPSSRWKWQWPAAVLVAVLTVSLPTSRAFLLAAWQRAVGVFSDDGSGGEHLTLLLGGLRLFADHPLLGVGTGEGSAIFFDGEVGFSSFHSVFTITAAEQGLVGVAALAVLFGMLALRFLPLPLTVAGFLSFALYLDMNRLPWLWGVFGVAAFVHRSVHAARKT